MSRGQGCGNIHADSCNLVYREWSRRIESLLKRWPLDEFHHQKWQSAGLRDRVDRDHLGTAYRGGGLRLADEAAAGRLAGGDLRRQNLEAHHAAKLLVDGLQHDAHAAAGDQLDHLIVAQAAEVRRIARWIKEVNGIQRAGSGSFVRRRFELARRPSRSSR